MTSQVSRGLEVASAEKLSHCKARKLGTGLPDRDADKEFLRVFFLLFKFPEQTKNWSSAAAGFSLPPSPSSLVYSRSPHPPNVLIRLKKLLPHISFIPSQANLKK